MLVTCRAASKAWNAARAAVLTIDGDEAVGLTPGEAWLLREMRRAHGLSLLEGRAGEGRREGARSGAAGGEADLRI